VAVFGFHVFQPKAERYGWQPDDIR
jgi:hypothetical protein